MSWVMGEEGKRKRTQPFDELKKKNT